MQTRKYIASFILICIISVASTACRQQKCPANGGSVDHVDLKKARHHKHQNGLFGKYIKSIY